MAETASGRQGLNMSRKKGATARFNIDDFVEYFNKGFGYTNLFVCYIPFADVVTNQGGGNVTLQQLTDKTSPGIALACTSAVIPGKTIVTKERFTQSVPKQFGYNIQYSDVTCNFIVDANMSGRNTWYFFNTWLGMIANPTTGYVGYHEEYSTEMHLSLMDHDNSSKSESLGAGTEGGNKIVGIKCTGVFPKALGEISLDMGSSDIAKFSVTFGLHRWFTTSAPEWSGQGAQVNNDFNAFDFSSLPRSEFAKLQAAEKEKAKKPPPLGP